MLVEDETRHIALINTAFCTMFNIPALPAQLIGTDCSHSAEQSKDMFVDSKTFVERIETILREQTLVTGEILHLKDGRVFSRDYVPVFYEDRYTGHLWHYHDMTHNFHTRRRWERMLRLEEINKETVRLFLQLDNVDIALNEVLAMTGHILDVSRAYVFRFRPNARILDNTHEWCASGVKPEIENLQGLPFDDLLPSFFPMLAQHDLIAPRHIRDLPEDLRGMLEPQDIQSVLWMPLYLDTRIEGFIGFDETRCEREWLPEEITMVRIIVESYARALEREESRRMLIKARDEALRTAQLRAQFVANMSHEIRTPMTGTLGMLELLLETELDDLQHEFAAEAYNSSSRLLRIINDILDFSKLEAGQIVLEADPIDLRAIATEVRMTLLPQIKDKQLDLVLDVPPAVPYRVYGDATRLRQVLMNLAGNAVKFTQRGTVTLSILPTFITDQITTLQFQVRDTGIGIAPEHLDRIFDSFAQADGSTTRKFGGSGLGLSISKQLVELMGGSISVESTPGTGSTFSFSLRLPIAQITGVDKTAKSHFTDLSALVVGDNRTARYVLAQHLENWGLRVHQVNTLDDVLRLDPSPAVDLLFLHGTSALRQAHAASASPAQARYVVCVDETPTEAADSYLHLTWPIDQSSLYNLLVKAIRQQVVTPTPDKPPQDEAVGGRILLVDDYPLNVDLVTQALMRLAVEVDFVENGQEALDRLKTTPYDLILMDMQMPVMDGITATRHIRETNTPYRHIPIIALTASVMREEQERYIASGVNEIIGKPFSVKHLREAVERWLRVVRLQQA